jgi:hypothetical protein
VSAALGIQHAMSMRRITSSSVACLDLLHFSTLSHKQYDFRGKKVTELKACVLFSPQLLSKTFLVLRRNQRYSTIKEHRSL